MNSNGPVLTVKHQLIILLLFTLGLNANTLFNQYALDDIVVLTENRFVQKGIKGIPKILKTEYTKGYSDKKNILTGARYRPLSLILFSLEYQFFGTKPMISHLINILLFGLLIVLLFKLLHSYLFYKQHRYLAFFACLLFVVHPVHTEVIANVKSRDEIITFIFLIISLITYIKYLSNKNYNQLIIALFCFFLALMTKETAITFIAVVPLVVYFCFEKSIKETLRVSIPFTLVFAVYMILRYLIVGFSNYPVNDVTNSPYLYATASEAFATRIFIIYKYIQLLFFPVSLTSDYGYNQIPYVGIFSFEFIFSFLLLSALILISIYTFKKKSLIAFSIIYFFVTLSVGTNFIVDLGTPMAERVLFEPSIAFCIILSFWVLKYYDKFKVSSVIFFTVAIILFSVKTIARNGEWKNNETLFFADVKSSPNSARLNLYACEVYIIKANQEKNPELRNELLKQAIYYGEKSLEIHPGFAYTYLRIGLAYYLRQNYFKAADYWIQAYKLEPQDPDAIKWTEKLSDELYKQGNTFYDHRKLGEAIECYNKSTELNAGNIEAWYNLGGIYLLKGDSANVKMAWDKVKILNPNHFFRKEDFLNN